MSSTHLSVQYHLIFSTRDRRPSIVADWRDRWLASRGGVVRTLGGIPEAVGGTADHVHWLVGLRATQWLADVLGDIKGEFWRLCGSMIRARKTMSESSEGIQAGAAS